MIHRYRALKLIITGIFVGLFVFSWVLPASAAGTERVPRPAVHPHVAVCSAAVSYNEARCLSRVRTDRVGAPQPVAGPFRNRARSAAGSAATIGNGGAYDPYYLQLAYNLTASASGAGYGQTVAIVDAYDDPYAASDLSYYRSFFGLPPCTSSNGCFRKVNQRGQQGRYPRPDSGWALEISLDLQMVSAICPNCKILLVEAQSSNFSDLETAVNTAAKLGANAISNSYGASEFSEEATSTYNSAYNHPGIAITASSGDSGYGVEFPAASQYVTAVGGTSLVIPTGSTSRPTDPNTETVWSGAGSGCSAFIAKPSWQTDAGCANRTVADVAAVADPNTGVWVYDSFLYGGWNVVGGTSVASPIVASVYALAGNTAGISYGSYSYGQLGSLFDVTSGSNGSCGTYLCTGGAGYDGPTGNGTPNGTGGF